MRHRWARWLPWTWVACCERWASRPPRCVVASRGRTTLPGVSWPLHPPPAQAQVTAVVEAKAVDKRLDYVAWLEIVCKFTDGLSDLDTLARKFAVFDQAGSGFITHGQFRTIFGSLGSQPMSLEDVEEFLLEADPGKTGRVEYRPWLEKFLAEAQQPIPDINAK